MVASTRARGLLLRNQRRADRQPEAAVTNPRVGRFGDGWPPGDHWPADGIVINHYGAEGEIACGGALFRGLKRRMAAAPSCGGRSLSSSLWSSSLDVTPRVSSRTSCNRTSGAKRLSTGVAAREQTDAESACHAVNGGPKGGPRDQAVVAGGFR